MKKYYFTFGIGQTLLANRYVEIEAETFIKARERMITSFGSNWCYQYPEEEWVKKDLANRFELQKLNVNEFWKM